MIEVLTVDDEPLALRQLEVYIRKIPFFHLAASCLSAKEAWKVLEEQKIDVMFCDINMPDINGLDFVKTLVSPPVIVFTTAYSEYAVEGYQVNALDYLLKPFSLDDFQRVATKVKKLCDMKNRANGTRQPNDTDPTTEGIGRKGDFFVRSDHKIIKIPVADVAYVEGMSEYLKIHFRDEQKAVVILMSMKTMEDQLPGNFMRIHRSYLINLHCITEMNKNRVFLGKDISLPIGDVYRDKLFEYVNDRALGKK